MAWQSVPNTVKAVLIWDRGGEELVNTLYFHNNAGLVDAAGCQYIADSLEIWWTTYLKPATSAEVTLLRIEVTDIDVQDSFQAVVDISVSGDLIGQAMPNQVTAAISFRTGLSGRTRRGRNYVPALRETDVNGNSVDQSILSLIQGAYQQLLPGGAINLTTWEWVVVSRYFNKVKRATGIVTPITTTFFVDDRVDTQRKRLP